MKGMTVTLYEEISGGETASGAEPASAEESVSSGETVSAEGAASGEEALPSEETVQEEDGFGVPVKRFQAVEVDNVLIGEPTTDDITTSTALYGKSIRYMLGIPKGDTHDWMDKKVTWTDAYGITHTCRTFGFPITGVEANIPGPWHMKVRCEEYG